MTVPLAARLDAMQSLARLAQGALPLGMNAIVMTKDGVLGIAGPPRPSRLHFNADGLPFNVAVSPEAGDGGAIGQIWAEVGHVPYTAQAPERRRRLIARLRAIQARKLPRATFILEGGHKILLFGQFRVDGHMTPEDLVHETVLLLQEARPFLRILAEDL